MEKKIIAVLVPELLWMYCLTYITFEWKNLFGGDFLETLAEISQNKEFPHFQLFQIFAQRSVFLILQFFLWEISI